MAANEIIGAIEVLGDISPIEDNTWALGTASKRFATVNGAIVTSGDLHLRDDERNAHWVLREETDRIVAINKITGKRYAIALTPIDDEKEET